MLENYAGTAGGGVTKLQSYDRLASLIAITIAAVDEETNALRRHETGDLTRFAERKGQALVNLNRHLQSDLPPDVLLSVKNMSEKLRQALIQNQRCLQVHIDAVSHVAQMIMKSVEAETSDGTYSRRGVQYGDD